MGQRVLGAVREWAEFDVILVTSGGDTRTFPAALGNDLVFTSRDYTRLVRSFALKQGFVTLLVPAAKWGGGTGDPSAEEVVRAPSLRPAGSCWLDHLLQLTPPSPSTEDVNIV